MTMLERLADEVWTACRDVRFPGGLVLPSRMTVLRLPNGEVWLHSPIAFDEALAGEIAALGPVRHLVGPCLYHHLHLRPWHERFPEARIHGVPGLAEKRRNLTFHGVLAGAPDPAWQGAVDQVLIEGQPKLNESVFLHRPSRTLIVTDLVFNVRQPRGFMTGLVLRMMGTHGRLALSRLVRQVTKDRAALAASLRRVLGWDFDRLVVAHGDPVLTGAKPALEAALWWGLGTPRPASPRAALRRRGSPPGDP